MNPALHYQLMQARVADWHAQARRDALARTARQAHRAQRHQPKHPAPGFPALAMRRVLAVLGARSP
jgi:hypothetical protein